MPRSSEERPLSSQPNAGNNSNSVDSMNRIRMGFSSGLRLKNSRQMAGNAMALKPK